MNNSEYKDQIVAFIKNQPICFLATIDKQQPRVRAMLLHRIDDAGLIFQIYTNREMKSQLTEGNAVELCFFNAAEYSQVRVRGVVKYFKDEAILNEIINAREPLRKWVAQNGTAGVLLFRVTNCQATLWTKATNFDQKKWAAL